MLKNIDTTVSTASVFALCQSALSKRCKQTRETYIAVVPSFQGKCPELYAILFTRCTHVCIVFIARACFRWRFWGRKVMRVLVCGLHMFYLFIWRGVSFSFVFLSTDTNHCAFNPCPNAWLICCGGRNFVCIAGWSREKLDSCRRAWRRQLRHGQQGEFGEKKKKRTIYYVYCIKAPLADEQQWLLLFAECSQSLRYGRGKRTCSNACAREKGEKREREDTRRDQKHKIGKENVVYIHFTTNTIFLACQSLKQGTS